MNCLRIRLNRVFHYRHLPVWIPKRLVSTSLAIRSQYFNSRSKFFSGTQNPNAWDEIEQEAVYPDINDNIYRDELQISLKEFFNERLAFCNPVDDYQGLLREKKDPSPVHDIMKITYSRFDNFNQICQQNNEFPPERGSLVEFIDPATNKANFGIVIQRAESKFNQNYNKVVLLTIANEILKVDSINISFHAYQVLDEAWISNLKILENRFDNKYAARLDLVSIIKEFLAESLKISFSLHHNFKVAYSQFANQSSVSAVSLSELIDSFQFSLALQEQYNISYYHQTQLLLACHLFMCDSPERWIVSSSYKPVNYSNIHLSKCSNGLIQETVYLTNSLHNSAAISGFLEAHRRDALLPDYNAFILELYSLQTSNSCKSFEKLNEYFRFLQEQKYKSLIDILKFLIIYPHPKLIKLVSQFEVFQNETVTPSTIYRFLKMLKLYDNSSNQLTDIYLSANLIGRDCIGQLAVSSTTDLDSSDTQKLSEALLIPRGSRDKFEHLRNSKKYYQDHVIYGLPLNQGFDSKDSKNSLMGISLEKINSRKYLFNVHIPDFVTRLSPSSNLFKTLMSGSHPLRSLQNLSNNESISILHQEVMNRFSFKNQDPHNTPNYYSVGDGPKSYTHNPPNETTCLTISYTINTFEQNYFLNMDENVTLTLDDISNVKIKNIDWSELEESLQTKNKNILPFRLFSRSKEVDQGKQNLNDSDHHRINFMHSVMHRHFKMRYLEGSNFNPAINIDADNSSNILKKLSYLNEGKINEKLITKLEALSIGDQNHFTRAKFFVNEIDMFISNIISNYCYERNIPIFTHSQGLSDNQEEASDTIISGNSEHEERNSDDEVLVPHNNSLLPAYHASSFYHTLLGKDANGYLSFGAFFIGRNYLSRPIIKILQKSPSSEFKLANENWNESTSHVSYGLAKGHVKLLDIFNDMEVYYNQLQIVSHLHLSYVNHLKRVASQDKRRSLHHSIIKQFSHLKLLGYGVQGELADHYLLQMLQKFINSTKLNQYFGIRHKNYWSLKMLEQRLAQQHANDVPIEDRERTIYECIITHPGYELPTFNKRISRAFCIDLNLEVDILVHLSSDANIGTTVDCDKVLLLDPVVGQCILKEAIRL